MGAPELCRMIYCILVVLSIIGIFKSSPHDRPVIFWISVFTPIAGFLCIFGLFLLNDIFPRMQAIGDVATLQEQALHPELRDRPKTNRVHSFHVASLPNYICDKEAVEGGCICPICKELFGKGDIMIQLPLCIHCFHKACIEAWLRRDLRCPVCRWRVDMEIPTDIALIV